MKINSCELVSITPNAEALIGYCARVSNKKNQGNPDVVGLLKYCIENQHWSIFEMANMVIEINTTLDISHQIVRHRSCSYQQKSHRYTSAGVEFYFGEPRMQDAKNRQNSTDTCSEEDKKWWAESTAEIGDLIRERYEEALRRGIAKECARKILPQATYTQLYMQGTIRSWIHYINLRCGNGTQKEHWMVAEHAKDIFIKHLPAIAEALGWLPSDGAEGKVRDDGLLDIGGILYETMADTPDIEEGHTRVQVRRLHGYEYPAGATDDET